MVEYNTVNTKLSSSQLNKLKSAVKQLRHTTKPRNAIEKNMSTNVKLSKAQISKIIQFGRFLGKLLGPLLKSGLPLTKNETKPLAKSVLIPLGLTAAASAGGVEIQKKKYLVLEQQL